MYFWSNVIVKKFFSPYNKMFIHTFLAGESKVLAFQRGKHLRITAFIEDILF